MEEYIGKEKIVHGKQWDAFHGGYFSNPSIARPLINTIKDLLQNVPTDVIVDLGGGTGFLLSQLTSSDTATRAKWVNVDCSEPQLALAKEQRISRVCSSLANLKRDDIADANQHVFFMMRSVLHYVGENGLMPLLCHLRAQAKSGEFFVHQTASFQDSHAADCLNALYKHMHTQKWYPTVSDLEKHVALAGFRITATTPAPPLTLTSEALAHRYDLTKNDVARIRETLAHTFGEIDGVFNLTPSGFHADLHYHIYTSVAAINGLS